MSEDLPRRAAVGVCVFRGDTVLLVRRGRAPNAGLWAPVGGKVEAGESLEAAALRETMEETGVACRLIGRSGRREIPARAADGTAFVHDLVVFAAVWLTGEPVAGDDAAEARFVPLDELEALPFVDGGVDHVRRARRLLDGSDGRDALDLDVEGGRGESGTTA